MDGSEDASGPSDGRRRPRLARLDTTGTALAGPGTLALFLLVSGVAVAVINGYVFPSVAFREGVFVPLLEASGGLIRPTQVVNWFLLAGVVGGILLGVGRLDPSDLGLEWATLWPATVATLGLWLVVQVVGVAFAPVLGLRIGFDAGLLVAPGAVVGAFLAQALGNALYEEVAFRGFLLVQVERRLAGRLPDPDGRLLVALALTGAVFALWHVPNRLFQGVPWGAIPSTLPALVLSGVLFGVIYYRTGNLLVAVGVHALGNTPATVVVPGDLAAALSTWLGLAMAVAWPWLDRLTGGRTVRQ